MTENKKNLVFFNFDLPYCYNYLFFGEAITKQERRGKGSQLILLNVFNSPESYPYSHFLPYQGSS